MNKITHHLKRIAIAVLLVSVGTVSSPVPVEACAPDMHLGTYTCEQWYGPGYTGGPIDYYGYSCDGVPIPVYETVGTCTAPSTTPTCTLPQVYDDVTNSCVTPGGTTIIGDPPSDPCGGTGTGTCWEGTTGTYDWASTWTCEPPYTTITWEITRNGCTAVAQAQSGYIAQAESGYTPAIAQAESGYIAQAESGYTPAIAQAESGYIAQAESGYQSSYESGYIPPSVDISANPTRVRSGNNSTISWSSVNVSSCSVTGPNFSSTALSGSQPRTITAKSLFSITCNGLTDSVTVNIVPIFEEF
jgi:hypothetical protein